MKNNPMDQKRKVIKMGSVHAGPSDPLMPTRSRRKPTHKELLEFVGLIARMTKDREIDDAGHINDLTNDDAVDTVHGLISRARELLSVPDRPDGDEDDDDREEAESTNAEAIR